VAEEEEEEVET